MPVAIPLAIAGSSIAGAAISSSASKNAAKTVQQGTDAATAESRRQFDELKALQMPGLNRANAAGDLYSQALGISRPQPQQQPVGQSYSPQPSMTGSSYSGGGYSGYDAPQARQFTEAGDMAVSPQSRLMTGSYTSGQGNVPAPQQMAENPAQGAAPVSGGGQLDIAQQVMQTPGYQAQLDQGLKSIDRAAPLVGGMYSGRRMKALEAEGQKTFGGYYENWMNRVGGVAGQEQQIASNVGNQGMQNAANVGNLMMTGANARAQGSLNSASAWTGALGNMAGGFAGYYG